MADAVANVIHELETRGWSSTRDEGQLEFRRDDAVIIGHQHHVSAQLGNFLTTEVASQYLTTHARLDFLLQHIRRFADMAETGALATMARWRSAEQVVQQASWDRALACPEALHLLERAADLLQSTPA